MKVTIYRKKIKVNVNSVSNIALFFIFFAFSEKDSNGQEFTVVLLDSEGIDAVSSGESNDHCIFTLTILLASVLIYNSADVPTRTDLHGLEYP